MHVCLQVRTLFVPWSEVVVIDNVIMAMNNYEGQLDNLDNSTSVTCDSHDYETMNPSMVAAGRLGSQSPSRSGTFTAIARERFRTL